MDYRGQVDSSCTVMAPQGILLPPSPHPDEDRPNKASSRSLLRGFIRKTRARLVVGTLASMLNAALTWATPWPMKILVDSVFGAKRLPTFLAFSGSRVELLYLVAATMVIFALLGGAATFVSALSFANAGQVFSNDLQVEVFDHIISQPPRFFDQRKSGDLTTRLIADVQAIQRALVESLPTLVNSTLTILGIMVILALLGPIFLGAVAVLGVFIALDLNYFMKKVKAQARRARNMEGLANSSAQQAIMGLVVVQTNQGETAESTRFSRFVNASTGHSLKANVSQASMSASVTTVLNIAIALFVLMAGVAVFNHTMSVGMILVVSSYARSIYKPLQQLTKRAGIVGVGLAAKERVSELLASDESLASAHVAPSHWTRRGAVEYQRVRFAYGGSEVIHGADLVIEAGSRVGLVGATGSGKSTLAKMLPRLLEPSEGTVRIDGIDTRDIPLQILRSFVAYLPQETFVFAGTLWENIVYGMAGATRIDAVTAAREAGLVEVFHQMPNGFDTVVTEKGTSLSGGQRQCVAIARAVARHAKIIVLDEPTIGIDPALEGVLNQAFERLTQGKTTIVVSHQRATLHFCERIYEVRNGVVSESSMGGFFDATPTESAQVAESFRVR